MFLYLDAASITSLSQLFSLSSSSATCLHSASFCCVSSQRAPAESNSLPLLMDCDIALIVSVSQQQLKNVASRQLTSHFCFVNHSFWGKTYHNEFHQIKKIPGPVTIHAFPFVRAVLALYLEPNVTA